MQKGSVVTVIEARQKELGLDTMVDKIIMKEVFHHLDFPDAIIRDNYLLKFQKRQ